MQGPDGQKIWSTGVYQELVAPERIVYKDSFADEEGNAVSASYYGMGNDIPFGMTVTVTFEDMSGKTKMTLRHEGIPAGEMSEMTVQGWNESFDKLVISLKN
jgi:uncharacterized protein YndB with AHSA1/START domain